MPGYIDVIELISSKAVADCEKYFSSISQAEIWDRTSEYKNS